VVEHSTTYPKIDGSKKLTNNIERGSLTNRERLRTIGVFATASLAFDYYSVESTTFFFMAYILSILKLVSSSSAVVEHSTTHSKIDGS
jgi:hypothetical protein